VYPHYHRKYVFVSLGGYWPSYTHCQRYYWYGWHPYDWYGYDPIPRQVNNYYTYNYYDDSTPGVDTAVLENLEPSPPPPYEGPGDQFFEEAVVVFEDGKYMVAANLFRQAMLLDPNDVIVPFAYTQALFAEKEYLLAVMALREALEKIDPDNSTIYYPRGLYADDDILFSQIDELLAKSDQHPHNRNLKLLLGYQLLGIGEIESAAGYLEQAGDENNGRSVKRLLDLVQTIRERQAETEVSEIKP
jgi:tetratricopeptide (TPR) repeat protein